MTGQSVGGRVRFHLGEPIKVEWHAPKNHSRRDWIGVYRVRNMLQWNISSFLIYFWQVGANTSTLETRTTSQGLWLGVHNEEWQGDIPVNNNEELGSDQEQGTLVFSGDRIPWHVGEYEVSSAD